MTSSQQYIFNSHSNKTLVKNVFLILFLGMCSYVFIFGLFFVWLARQEQFSFGFDSFTSNQLASASAVLLTLVLLLWVTKSRDPSRFLEITSESIKLANSKGIVFDIKFEHVQKIWARVSTVNKASNLFLRTYHNLEIVGYDKKRYILPYDIYNFSSRNDINGALKSDLKDIFKRMKSPIFT